jgi:tRNA(Arg) A34 adenosine deaminase TadA
MFLQPGIVEFSLPNWLSDYVNGVGPMENLVDRMRFVIGASWRNVEERTGGPFAAAVFDTESGLLVSLGVNLVASQKLSILHAEMVAIALAQRQLGRYDLGADRVALELVCSTEPCAMCFGAIPWSGVRHVVTGAGDADARAIGFDEGPKPAGWVAALKERGIAVTTGILADEAAEVLRAYAQNGGVIYNSRES